ncbi:MAG TPA: PAS domain S-box protein, partial [Dermatophilaceae bacterium]
TDRPLGTGLALAGRRADGTDFPADIALSQMHTPDGPLVIAAVRDMTTQRASEVARARLELLAAVVESSAGAIIGSTLDGVITSWNPGAEKLYGYRAGEVIGRPVGVLSPRGREGEIAAILARVSQGHPVERRHTLRVRKDGMVIAVSLSASPILDGDGVVVGASSIANDLTGVEEAYALSRAMLEASLDSFVAISAGGTITDANEATVRLTGVSRDVLIGTPFPGYFTDPTRAEEIYQHVFSAGMAMDYPLTVRHSSGTLIHVRYNASVIRNSAGAVLGVFAAARDVTAQMADQSKVAASHQAELERLAELERFQRLTVGRELKMMELKEENKRLRAAVRSIDQH